MRVWALVSYAPAELTANAHDAADYVRAARVALSEGSQEPLGYPLFLRLIHAFSHSLAFTIVVQHALGLLAGLLLWLMVRRTGAPTWAAAVPAVVVWFCGDELFLEHALLSEALFTFMLAATLYAAVRALGSDWRWSVLAGALAASLLAIRTVGLPVLIVVIVWLALSRWRMRLPWRPAAAASLCAAVLVVLAYATVHHQSTGRWTVFVDGSGWILYGRAAEFANCRDFKPPSGTRVLCDSTPTGRRQGPMYYLYTGGPAHRVFGEPAHHDAQVREFAIAAILHQPVDFLGFAATDLVRYVDPGAGTLKLGDYVGPQALRFPSGRPVLDPETLKEVDAYYGPVRAPTGSPARGLHDYQQVLRLNGVIVLVALIAALAGIAFADGEVRLVIVLLSATALALTVLPALTHSEWRFVVPAEGPIAAAAALAVWSTIGRYRRRPAAI